MRKCNGHLSNKNVLSNFLKEFLLSKVFALFMSHHFIMPDQLFRSCHLRMPFHLSMSCHFILACHTISACHIHHIVTHHLIMSRCLVATAIETHYSNSWPCASLAGIQINLFCCFSDVSSSASAVSRGAMSRDAMSRDAMLRNRILSIADSVAAVG